MNHHPFAQMPQNRYNLFHALAAIAVLVATVSKGFWHNFLHGGFSTPPAVSMLLTILGLQTALFGSLLLVLWVSTLFARRPDDKASKSPEAFNTIKALKLAALAFVPMSLAAFGLEWLSTFTLENAFHLQPAGQDLVKWLQPGTYPAPVRFLLMAFAVLEAPLIEEPLFRGVMFRGLAKSMPAWGAMLVSGFVFALIHVNAATLVPLWFLGIVFAWLYWRTGSIIAPMFAHFLFNLTNLVLIFAGVAT